MKSKYEGKCKDCGKEHNIGDEINKNNNDHWCKDGEACKGVTQTPTKSINTTDPYRVFLSTNPTIETYVIKGEKDAEVVLGTYIGVLKACERLGNTEPAFVGMILNNVMRLRG